ncbi:MAG: acetyl-CoA carboxylase biotin carboxyl carrier protein [Candidatus Saccharicenans sp.]|nr:MAG: acetyl-CoA carboxylase biotin carboxyl carrier protein [Candidatus Aminicenantes bacterium]HEK86544.1 acetyl-CoA carboxylase biotin carboxyl carrier protein [Candidatus Aminicenantes bacterium]
MNQKNGKPVESGKESPFSSKIDYEELKKLIALLEEKNLSQFELEVEGFKIKLSRNVPSSANLVSSVIPAINPLSAANAPVTNGEIVSPTPTPVEDKSLHYITSPMVGTFYRAPSPTSPPFVDIGDTVKKGQTLCIIEAMKLMNEIESDVNGIITDILVENGKPVEYGQKLFAVKVSG